MIYGSLDSLRFNTFKMAEKLEQFRADTAAAIAKKDAAIAAEAAAL